MVVYILSLHLCEPDDSGVSGWKERVTIHASRIGATQRVALKLKRWVPWLKDKWLNMIETLTQCNEAGFDFQEDGHRWAMSATIVPDSRMVLKLGTETIDVNQLLPLAAPLP